MARHADPACPRGICDGSGWIAVDETTARPCECRELRAKSAVSRRLGTGIPRRFQGVSLERRPICDMDPWLLRDVIRPFLRDIDRKLDEGRGLWFYGDVGTGKTSLAMLVARTALERGRSVAIYSVPHLLAHIRSTYEDAQSGTYMQLFRRLCDVELLLLDDLGTENRTEWVLEQLYTIVNERWQNGRSVVGTSNVNPLELREQIGERTVSRLFEICGEAIPVMGPDRRILAAGP